MQQLKNFKNYLRGVEKYQTSRDDDLIILVIGNEGAGKSTLMLQATWFWEQIVGDEPSPDDVLDRVVWGDREEYKSMMLNSNEGDIITVQDAAHVLYAKEAMHGDQIEIEKALLDTRINNYLQLLGFQDWRDVPDGLRRRRAQHAIHVYKNHNNERGHFDVFGRSELDEKYKDSDSEWPDPMFHDEFPSLEGTELWKQFEERDEQAKRSRLEGSKEVEVDDARKQEQIKIAIKARQPWKENPPMTFQEVAKLTDYSYSWVRNRCNEWKDGAYRDLISKEDAANSMTA